MLPLFLLPCFIYNCMLFIETPEVKWKHFLFIPGGTEWKPNPADAKDQCIPEPSYFFLLFPPIIFLPGPKNPPTRSFLKLHRWSMGSFMPFQISLPFVEPGVRGSTFKETDCVLGCATAGCFHHISALLGVLWATVPANDRASLPAASGGS